MSGSPPTRAKKPGKRLLRGIVRIAVVLVVLAVALWVFQRKLVYPGAAMTFAPSPAPAGVVERWVT
ncbi:MAG: hypothetical protein AAGL98_12580 [Planctomycetota bacterium]